MELLQKPLIKIIALILIFYFGLFANKEHPDSLGNRLSADKIKKDFNEVQEKSHFILYNINAAKQSAEGNVVKEVVPENLENIEVKDLINGSGANPLKCGDEAEISYQISVVGSDSNLETGTKKILIGSNENYMLEKKITNMKVGGTRIVKVARNFKSNNKQLEFMLKFNEADLQYKINLLKILGNNAEIKCYEN